MRTSSLQYLVRGAASALLIAAVPASSRAQDSTTRSRIDAAIEVGSRSYLSDLRFQQRAKFEEYKVVPGGGLIENALIRFSPDSFRLFDLAAQIGRAHV